MSFIKNYINGEFISTSEKYFEKKNPHDNKLMYEVINSREEDLNLAIESSKRSFEEWYLSPGVERGKILSDIANRLRENSEILSKLVAEETGKSLKDASGEVSAAILQAEFFSGEGMRLYGKSLTSSVKGKYSHTIRQARGLAGLIVPANTPIANIAWKIFPALVCGNTAILKASEDAPKLAQEIASIIDASPLPKGVFNVLQGDGVTGSLLVNHKDIDLISFTGSTKVGLRIAQDAAKSLKRVSLELGGKNTLVICDDADIDKAVDWAVLSAFSNAGQRCAAGGKFLIFKEIYEDFLYKFTQKTKDLKLGVYDDCDLGPLISQRQKEKVLEYIDMAISDGGKVLCGASLPEDPELLEGNYILPTIIDGLSVDSKFANLEFFGPLASTHKISDIQEALKITNNSTYGLSSSIHTKNIDTALWFTRRVRTGVANVNLGTYGSEPHMPFGGFNLSGNGTREPGLEALDVYSELKNITFLNREDLI